MLDNKKIILIKKRSLFQSSHFQSKSKLILGYRLDLDYQTVLDEPILITKHIELKELAPVNCTVIKITSNTKMI